MHAREKEQSVLYIYKNSNSENVKAKQRESLFYVQ
jgi:hypothetical protein